MCPIDQKKEKNSQSFYNSVYYKQLPEEIGPSGHIKRLVSRLRIQKDQRVLDVACGKGEWLLACSWLGAKPYGVDISDKVIDCCKALMCDGKFYAQSAESLPFENNYFDVVSCFGALEHFNDPGLALREIVRVAKSNAKIILLVPNADFLTYKLGLFSGTNQKEVKEVFLTLKEWQFLFESSGLQVQKRWKDLHVLSWSWILLGKWWAIPFRVIQALALAVWPLNWQYQVYHLCKK